MIWTIGFYLRHFYLDNELATQTENIARATGFRGTRPYAIVHAVLEFSWGMSDCTGPYERVVTANRSGSTTNNETH